MKEKYRRLDWSDYNKNRERVCEIYGVDPRKAHVHHIVFRHDVVNDPAFAGFDLNQLSNLYPFSEDNPAPHTDTKDHEALHLKVGKQAYEQLYKPKVIYQKRR